MDRSTEKAPRSIVYGYFSSLTLSVPSQYKKKSEFPIKITQQSSPTYLLGLHWVGPGQHRDIQQCTHKLLSSCMHPYPDMPRENMQTPLRKTPSNRELNPESFCCEAAVLHAAPLSSPAHCSQFSYFFFFCLVSYFFPTYVSVTMNSESKTFLFSQI